MSYVVSAYALQSGTASAGVTSKLPRYGLEYLNAITTYGEVPMTAPLAFSATCGRNILLLAGGKRTILFVGWPKLGQALADAFGGKYNMSRVVHQVGGDCSSAAWETWNIDVCAGFGNEMDSTEVYNEVLVFLLAKAKELINDEGSMSQGTPWYNQAGDIVEQYYGSGVATKSRNAEIEQQLIEDTFGANAQTLFACRVPR